MQRFFEERNPRAQRNAEAMNLAGGSKRDNRGEQQQWEPNVGIEPRGRKKRVFSGVLCKYAPSFTVCP